jgi:hypothetical protein
MCGNKRLLNLNFYKTYISQSVTHACKYVTKYDNIGRTHISYMETHDSHLKILLKSKKNMWAFSSNVYVTRTSFELTVHFILPTVSQKTTLKICSSLIYQLVCSSVCYTVSNLHQIKCYKPWCKICITIWIFTYRSYPSGDKIKILK